MSGSLAERLRKIKADGPGILTEKTIDDLHYTIEMIAQEVAALESSHASLQAQVAALTHERDTAREQAECYLHYKAEDVQRAIRELETMRHERDALKSQVEHLEGCLLEPRGAQLRRVELLQAEVTALTQERARLRELVAHQAEDAGLWCMAQTTPEDYLQQELRKLHAAIEGDALTPPAEREEK